MDFMSFLRGGTSGPDLVALHREEARVLREEAKLTEKRCRAIDAATGTADALSRLDTGGGFGSYTFERWFFVSSYAHDGGERPTLTSFEGLIVPEAVQDQNRHRPKAQTPEQAAEGVVTMTSVPVSGREIASEAAAQYASGVRLGTFADVLREPCAACGALAIVFCEHYFDTSNEFQSLFVRRLCLRCPHVQDVASASCDLCERLPLLPLVQPHRKRHY